MSPYFSPNKRHRLVFVDGHVDGHVLDDFHAVVAQNFLIGEVLDVLQLLVLDAGKVRKIKAQAARIDQRSGLLDVGAEHAAQRRMQQVRAGVMAHGGPAPLAVDHRIQQVAYHDGLPRRHLMGAHALHGIVNAAYVGDECVVIGGIEPAFVGRLSARLGVERGVVEHDFALLARLQLLHALAVADDGQHLASARLGLAIAFKNRSRKRGKHRSCRCLACALPRGARLGALCLHRKIEARLIELNALVARGVDHEVQGQAEGVVELESLLARIHCPRSWILFLGFR